MTTPNLEWLQNGTALTTPDSTPPIVTVIIVSYKVPHLMRECLTTVFSEFETLAPAGFGYGEVLVVDNNSGDGSCEMILDEFPAVRLCRSSTNLGFGPANNVALAQARGRYLLLLNSDAFLGPGILATVLARMQDFPRIGIGGVQQVGRDGSRQPSAREFHSIWGDAMVMTGLGESNPDSALWGKIFGGIDRKWASVTGPTDVDWLPGAFLLLSRTCLETIGGFDPRFFLYLEEVDLCKRARNAGFLVRFWPDLSVVHVGGESARSVKQSSAHRAPSQVVLWRMRSTLLYYRKWHGTVVWASAALEIALYSLRWLRNRWSSSPLRRPRAAEAETLIRLTLQAWKDTRGGRVSPPQPW